MPQTASWTVRPICVEGEWGRGPAVITEEKVVVHGDSARWEAYNWSLAPQLPYDLAGIRHEVDILGFVRRWGLLHDIEDQDAEVPNVEEFEDEALQMTYILYLYGLISRPGHPSAGRALIEYWAGVYTGAIHDRRRWLWSPHDRKLPDGGMDRLGARADLEAMAVDVREALEELLWDYLPKVEMSLHSLDFMEWAPGERPPPGQFVLTSRPRDLLARAYVEVALEMTAGVAVEACPEDGRLFAVRDPRQIYCSTQCAGRARYRRFASRRRGEGD